MSRVALAAAGDRSDHTVRDAIAAAAEALGNTVAVCRSSYVAPVAIEAFEDGRLAAYWRQTRRGTWLSRAERATDRLLSHSWPPEAAAERAGRVERPRTSASER